MKNLTLDAVVVGAGISGICAARELQRSGCRVAVLEKSRGLGGRAATRRWNGLPVDHGAQFFTARSPEFKDEVLLWTKSGLCHEWTRGFHSRNEGVLLPPQNEDHPRYVCREGMSSLARNISAGADLAVELQTKVVFIATQGGSWRLVCENGNTIISALLVLTCPPPQGALLLRESAPEIADLLDGIVMAPCLALVAAYPSRRLEWKGIQSSDPVISWIGNDTSKRPESHDGRTVVVIHASADFSREHYDASEESIAGTMLSCASAVAETDLSFPAERFLQRWRYAQSAKTPDEHGALRFDAPAPLILAGDSFAGGKIEGAWLSGVAAGKMPSCG